MAIRGPHGLGKSAVASMAVLWFATTREAAGVDWKIPTTASVGQQLFQYFWPEIRKWAFRLRWDALGLDPWRRGHELLEHHIKLRHGEAFALTAADPSAIEGAHATELLYVFDEAKAISDGIYDAAEGAFSTAGLAEGSNAYAIAISTPGEPVGRFYEIHARRPGTEAWWVRHVTIDEAVRAGRVTREWVDQQHLLWGDSAVYANRVLGEFAASSEDTVIPLAWVEAACDRWRAIYEPLDPDTGERVPVGRARHVRDGTRAVIVAGDKLHTLGVDVARGGEDRSVIALRQGNTIAELRRYPYSDDTMLLANQVDAIQTAHGDPRAVIDVIGVGAGVYDRQRERGRNCVGFNSSAGTKRTDITGEFGFCLTGDTPIWPIGDLRAVYRSRFDCPFYRVKLASGHDFTATANHQVLALVGGASPAWAAVHTLRPGCHLVRPLLGQGTGLGDPDIEQMPPQISEVYSTAREVCGTERIPGRRVHFYGDRPVGEVDVVAVDRPLLAFDESRWQHVAQFPLDRLLAAQREMPGQGASAGQLGAHGGSGRSVDRLRPVSRQSMTFSGRDILTSPQAVGLRIRPGNDPVLHEHPFDRPLPGVHVRGDGDDRLPRLIAGSEGGAVEGSAPSGGPIGVRGLSVAHLFPSLDEYATNYALVEPKIAAYANEGLTGLVATDHVVSIEMVDPGWHERSFAYTLETATGTYATATVLHRNTNSRSWAWWNLREMLDPASGCDVALPPDDRLIGDLTTPKWKLMSGGRIQIESKDDIRKRLGRSPDDGDAVVYSYTETGGSWADLYRASEEPDPDDDTPQPRGPASRARRWADVYKTREQVASGDDPKPAPKVGPSAAPAPVWGSRPGGGWFR